ARRSSTSISMARPQRKPGPESSHLVVSPRSAKNAGMKEIPMPELLTIRCLADNYAYLLHGGGETVLIDAPEAAPVLAALADRGWRLDRILLTHHHADHVQAVPELVTATGARVAGNRLDAARLPPLDEAFAPGERLAVAG